MENMGVIGTGPMGQAMVGAAIEAGQRPWVWGRSDAGRQAMLASWGDKITWSDDVGSLCAHSSVIALAIPALALRENLAVWGEYIAPDHVVLHGCRGVDAGFVRVSTLIRENTCARYIAVLGGMLFHRDVHAHVLGGVIASRFDDVHGTLHDMLAPTMRRLRTTYDVIGVEICNAMGHVTDVALGYANGLGWDLPSTHVLSAYGLAEASRLGVAQGADPQTFRGMAGIAELLPHEAVSSMRHREVGKQLAQGMAVEYAHLEGVRTAYEVQYIAKTLGLHLPLVHAVCAVLEQHADAAQKLRRVLDSELAVA